MLRRCQNHHRSAGSRLFSLCVAEYTVALMLSLNRKIPRASWRTKDGNFSLHGLMGFDVCGKTAGIIGTGKIAKILIHILKGFGMNVLAYDLYRTTTSPIQNK